MKPTEVFIFLAIPDHLRLSNIIQIIYALSDSPLLGELKV